MGMAATQPIPERAPDTAAKTFLTKAQQEAIELAFRDVREFAEAMSPSRERSLLLTKLDEAKMWAFAHYRVAAGGSP